MSLNHLSFEEQLNKFIERNMISNDHQRDAKKLQHISYYKFKEIADPFSVKHYTGDGTHTIDYQQVQFTDMVARFYQDKNLRLHLLHAIEKIEISFKTQFAYLLGEKYGPYGYLNFSTWSNRKKFNKNSILKAENKFKHNLKNKIKYNPSEELKNQTRNTDFPTVWLAINLLTFGEILNLFELMSIDNQRKVSDIYNMTPNKLISRIKTVRLVRNLCAHNSNIIDLKLTTTPQLNKEEREYVFHFTNGQPTNRLAVPTIVICDFVKQINKNYIFRNIKKCVRTICRSNALAKQFGFKSQDSVGDFFKYLNT